MFSDRLQADYETAFKLAIENINDDTSLLQSTQLKVIVNNSATLDAFRNIEMGKSPVRKDVCYSVFRESYGALLQFTVYLSCGCRWSSALQRQNKQNRNRFRCYEATKAEHIKLLRFFFTQIHSVHKSEVSNSAS